MADPKYANLFGIAYDQPDVYETDDLPEEDQDKDLYDHSSIGNADCIERLHISAKDALKTFKGKSLVPRNVDFSDRLSKKIRTGYDARSGDWELVGVGEKETPIQKYQRLQCEMKELMEEISALKETAKDENAKDSLSFPVVDTQLEKMQKQLSDLQLEESLGSELISSLNDPQGAQYKKMLAQLQTFNVGSSYNHEDSAQADKAGHLADGLVQYQMTLRPGHIQLEKTYRLTELEQRITKMESLIGATPAKLGRLGGGDRSLLETAQLLSSRAAMLDPAQLEAAEARVSALSSKLDHVAEKTSSLTGSLDSEKEKKISELYEIAKKTEHLSQILPQTLERLISLKELHQQGGEFAKTIGELESVQVRLSANTYIYLQ
uniref:Dynactin subunit 2 n=1 Tax=Clastoptera arizonana TaxID=38151 RepID=A0A1B6CNR5_9HEMI